MPIDRDAFWARLDDEHRRELESRRPFDLDDIVATRARSAADPRDEPSAAGRAVAVTDHTTDAGVLVRVFTPPGVGPAAPLLYGIHGGGQVLGSLAESDTEFREMAVAIGCVVASPEYRLAPEHPFPAAIDDCYEGLVWVVGAAEELGVDPGRVAVGGGSAGGGLAAALALVARDRGGPAIAFQWLIFPMLDDRGVSESSHIDLDPRTWTRADDRNAWRAVLGEAFGTDDVSPYAAPARATDLRGLPPAYIAVGDLDLYLDEDVDYALRLGRAGVPAELHVYPGALHGGDGGAPRSTQGRRWRRDMCDALRTGLGIASA